MDRIKIAATLAAAAIALAACGGGDNSKSKEITPPSGAREACVALLGGDIKNWSFSPLEKAANNDCYLVQRAENQ